jgi:hypothetical protein
VSNVLNCTAAGNRRADRICHARRITIVLHRCALSPQLSSNQPGATFFARFQAAVDDSYGA